MSADMNLYIFIILLALVYFYL